MKILDEIKEMTEKVGEIKPNTKNVYYGVGGDNKNNAWVESIYNDNDVLMVRFQVSVPGKVWGYEWAYCTDTAENFFNSVENGYENELNGTIFDYSPQDIKRCVEHCRDYCEWYIRKDEPYFISFS